MCDRACEVSEVSWKLYACSNIGLLCALAEALESEALEVLQVRQSYVLL